MTLQSSFSFGPSMPSYDGDVAALLRHAETGSSRSLGFPPTWMDEKLVAIRRLEELESDWDSYGASPISPESIMTALEKLERQFGQVTTAEPDVSATPTGNVRLEWEWDGDSKSLSVEFLPGGAMRYGYTDFSDPLRDREGESEAFSEIVPLLPDHC